MRTHEALLLGSTMLKPVAGMYLNPDKSEGCAMGMIAVAGGCVGKYVPEWMPQWMNSTQYALPCACKEFPSDTLIMMGGCQMGFKYNCNTPHQITVHLFNYHVMTKKDWSIEQVADYLRTIEPKEETENGDDHNGSACGDQNNREAAREKETSGAR